MLNLTALKNPSRHKLAAQKDLHQTKEHIDEHQRDDANVEVEDPNPNEANWLPDGMSQVQQTRRNFLEGSFGTQHPHHNSFMPWNRQLPKRGMNTKAANHLSPAF